MTSRIERPDREAKAKKLGRPFWSVGTADYLPADGGEGTHARQPIARASPCAWVARRCPPPLARRSPPPPHLALGTSASLGHLHSCSLRCPQQPLHDVPCQAALVLGWRADVLRRRPAARRRRISHSAQAPPLATCTPAACDAPSSLSTTSRAPRGQLLLLLAVPSSCSSLPSRRAERSTDRADHAASVPPAALRTQSTRRKDEPPG